MDTANLVEIFCIFDEFCKYFEIELKKHVIEDSGERHRNCKRRVEEHRQIDPTRHRTVNNFTANLLAGMIACNFMPKKPSMNVEIIDMSRLIA